MKFPSSGPRNVYCTLNALKNIVAILTKAILFNNALMYTEFSKGNYKEKSKE